MGVSLERGRTRKGFNYPRVHYFPREGRYLKIRRAIGTAKGRCRGQSTQLRLRRRNYKSFPFNVN